MPSQEEQLALAKSGQTGSLQDKILGPPYDYSAKINDPAAIGMRSSNTMGALADNIGGLLSYVQLLVAGGGRASKVPGPLGNKFFVETTMQCRDVDSGQNKQRSIYINNVPDGSLPFASGTGFKDFRGILPGMINNITQINPFQILNAFVAEGVPECQEIELDTIESDSPTAEPVPKKAFVTTADIMAMSPCWFSDGKQPLTGETCKSGFTTLRLPQDPLVKVYVATLGVLGGYMLYRLVTKKCGARR
jgi:hypothetical protein